MPTNRLKANICGTSYTLVSEESLSYMRDLVAQVDEEMTGVMKDDPRISTTMAAVLTALTETDRANKEKAAADRLRLEMKRAIDEQEHLQNALSDAKAETERLRQEMLRLRNHR
ncbi:MAG: cell division protein ZapA [Acutalibacteraceae bacterium]